MFDWFCKLFHLKRWYLFAFMWLCKLNFSDLDLFVSLNVAHNIKPFSLWELILVGATHWVGQSKCFDKKDQESFANMATLSAARQSDGLFSKTPTTNAQGPKARMHCKCCLALYCFAHMVPGWSLQLSTSEQVTRLPMDWRKTAEAIGHLHRW